MCLLYTIRILWQPFILLTADTGQIDIGPMSGFSLDGVVLYSPISVLFVLLHVGMLSVSSMEVFKPNVVLLQLCLEY